MERPIWITEFTKKNSIQTPLTLKVSPDIAEGEIGYIIEFMKKFKISGVIISNTTDKNRESLSGLHKNEVGGLSGEPLKNVKVVSTVPSEASL